MAPSSPHPTNLIAGYISGYLDQKNSVSGGPTLGIGDVGYFGDEEGNSFYSFNSFFGIAIGEPFFVGNPVTSSPAICSPDLVVIETNSSTSGQTIAINPTAHSIVWCHPTKSVAMSSTQHSSPTIGPDGDVVVNTMSGDVFRWKAATGALVWHSDGFGAAGHTVVFSRSDDLLFFSNGTSMTALNYADGSMAWTNSYPGAVSVGAPGVAPDGTLVFGTDSGDVYGLNPKTGAQVWQDELKGGVEGAPAFDSAGRVFIPTKGNSMVAFSTAAGDLLWTYTSDGICEVGASVDADGRLYFLDHAGYVYCLTTTGQFVWKLPIGGEGTGSIAIGPDDTLYVGNAVPLSNTGGVAVVRQMPPIIRGMSLASGKMLSGSTESGNITLAYGAPPNGEPVGLSSTNPTAVSVPAAIVIKSGVQSQPFTVTASRAINQETMATITATTGSVSYSATLQVDPTPLAYIQMGTTIYGGTGPAGGYVQLNFLAPAGGLNVSLSSSNPAVLQVSPSAAVLEGQTSGDFSYTASAVATRTTVTVYASYGGETVSTEIFVEPATLGYIYVSPATVQGGRNSDAVVHFYGESSDSIPISISASSVIVTVPSTVDLPAGTIAVSFPNSNQAGFDLNCCSDHRPRGRLHRIHQSHRFAGAYRDLYSFARYRCGGVQLGRDRATKRQCRIVRRRDFDYIEQF